MARFSDMDDIVAHIRGKFPQQRYVGKDYTVADLIVDLEEFDAVNVARISPTAFAKVFYGRDPDQPPESSIKPLGEAGPAMVFNLGEEARKRQMRDLPPEPPYHQGLRRIALLPENATLAQAQQIAMDALDWHVVPDPGEGDDSS